MALNSHWRPSRSPQRRTTEDEIVSLQLFQLNWVLIAIILGVFCCGLVLTGFRVNLSGYLAVLGMAGLYGYFGHRNTRSVSRNPRVFATLFMLAQIILLLLLLTSISYIAASANLPMQETNLLALDRMLGLDFRAYLTFVNHRPSLISALAQTYNSIHRQLFVLVLLLPLSGQYRRAAEFVLGFAIALTFTIIISTLV